MLTFRIRLIKYPERWVGKKGMTYAIDSDARLEGFVANRAERSNAWTKEELIEFFSQKAYWFTQEKYARIYTERRQIQALLTLASWNEENPTFSEYEVVIDQDGQQTIEPLDNFKKPVK